MKLLHLTYSWSITVHTTQLKTLHNFELDHIDNRLQLSIAKLVTWFRGQIRGREYLARRLETLVPVLRSVPRIAGERGEEERIHELVQ